METYGKIIKKRSVSNKVPQIRWNQEMSEEMQGDDNCIDFHFFIKSRNPKNILDKIEREFEKRTFKSPLKKVERAKGGVSGTINEYLLVTYTTLRSPERFSFNWTDLPVIPDKNLSNNYKKRGNIEDYIQRFL